MFTKMRIFLAIELPAEIRRKVKNVQDMIQDSSTSSLKEVKWVEENNIHLTLKFLGELIPKQIESLIQGAKEAVQSSIPFSLSLKNLGAFPGWSRASVVWVGVETGREEVIRIYKRLEETLSSLQFEKEGRPYSPHVTIGRIKRRRDKGNRQYDLEKPNSDFSTEAFHVEKVSVMKSTLTPTGPIYERIESIPLGKTDSK
jgi:2'-5' RNA ligase